MGNLSRRSLLWGGGSLVTVMTVMKTLRAALMGAMHGPDLMQSWLILHQRRYDQPRLQAALRLAQGRSVEPMES